MTLTAIVVNYFTEVFLPVLLGILDKEECIDQIVIADNGSAKDLEQIAADFSKVRIKKFDHNIGFGAAINRVTAVYPSGFYLIINPDTLPKPGFAAHLFVGARQTNNWGTLPACKKTVKNYLYVMEIDEPVQGIG